MSEPTQQTVTAWMESSTKKGTKAYQRIHYWVRTQLGSPMDNRRKTAKRRGDENYIKVSRSEWTKKAWITRKNKSLKGIHNDSV